MPKTAVKIGPQDHGRRLSLAEFNHAEVQEGYLYELARGVIVVSDVPHDRHFAQVDTIRVQLDVYRAAHPGEIHRIGGGSECKLLIGELEAERHPDLVIYKKPRPRGVKDFWAEWVPEIVVEVVSRTSTKRDYLEKPEEYLLFGVKEYWIVDADQETLVVLRRHGKRWRKRTCGPGDVYKTRLLPGFELHCDPVFAAARAADD